MRVDARFARAYSAVVSPVSHDTPPLRTQLHAERVSGRRSRARSDALSPQHAARCSTDASDIRAAHGPCPATRRLTDTRRLTSPNPRRLTAYATITSWIPHDRVARSSSLATAVRSRAPADRCRQHARVRAAETARRPQRSARSSAQIPEHQVVVSKGMAGELWSRRDL